VGDDPGRGDRQKDPGCGPEARGDLIGLRFADVATLDDEPVLTSEGCEFLTRERGPEDLASAAERIVDPGLAVAFLRHD